MIMSKRGSGRDTLRLAEQEAVRDHRATHEGRCADLKLGDWKPLRRA